LVQTPSNKPPKANLVVNIASMKILVALVSASNIVVFVLLGFGPITQEFRRWGSFSLAQDWR